MGIELVFFGSFMNNIGDYTSDPVRAARDLSVKIYPFKLSEFSVWVSDSKIYLPAFLRTNADCMEIPS